MKIENKRKLEINILTIFLMFYAIVLILFIQTKEESVTYELCKNSKQEYYSLSNEQISMICKINGAEKTISVHHNEAKVDIKGTKKKPYVEIEGRYWRPKLPILNSCPTDIRNICELKTVTIYIPEGTEL